jgi:hypothetical protein
LFSYWVKNSFICTKFINECNITLVAQDITEYMIFPVMINRFTQTSIKVINLQAVCFTECYPLSQFHVLFLGNDCRLSSCFAANKKCKHAKLLVKDTLVYYIMLQILWVSEHVSEFSGSGIRRFNTINTRAHHCTGS